MDYTSGGFKEKRRVTKDENETGIGMRAVVCYANYAQFHTDHLHVLNPSVKSRMCLWCKGGSGRVIVNGRTFTCERGDYFVLPWDHRVEYFADRQHPFYLAGIHIVPDHDTSRVVDYTIPHTVDHPLAKCAWRKDCRIPELDGVQHLHVTEDSPLYLLSESIVQLFLRGGRD
jgi:hypothetical protein